MISPYLHLLKQESKVADTIKMHTLNLKVDVAELWVSQTEVVAGQPDTMTWYKIGDNDQLKYIDEYSFAPVTLPGGEYKSIKMVFKNICYRLATYMSDTSQVIEMRESMGSYEDPCDYEGTVPVDYFSANGNHNIDTTTNTFYVASAGEHVGGFNVNPGAVTRIYWRLGGTYDSWFDWIDVNNNGILDCGIDKAANFVVPPKVT